jgi:hypothetical protein
MPCILKTHKDGNVSTNPPNFPCPEGKLQAPVPEQVHFIIPTESPSTLWKDATCGVEFRPGRSKRCQVPKNTERTRRPRTSRARLLSAEMGVNSSNTSGKTAWVELLFINRDCKA